MSSDPTSFTLDVDDRRLVSTVRGAALAACATPDVADGSGVIVVPGDAVERVLGLAPRVAAYEREIKRRTARGEDIVEGHEDADYEDSEARSRVEE